MRTLVAILLLAPAALALPEGLGDPSPAARREAVRTLAERGEAALPDLGEALRSKRWLVRATACIALGEIGPAAAETLRPAFGDPDELVRHRAARAAGGMAGSAAARELLLGALADGSPLVREGAAAALAGFGAGAVEPLVAVLGDSEPLVRAAAARSLGAIGGPAVVAAPDLLDLFETKGGWPVVVAAREALEALGETAIPALEAALAREDAWQSHHAAGILAGLGPPGIAALVRRVQVQPLGSPLEALVKLGPAAKPAVPALLRWLDDDRDWFRRRVAEAIAKIDPGAPGLMPVFLGILRDGPPHAAYSATWGVALIGPPAREAVPLLEKLLFGAKPGHHERSGAIRALAAIDGEARPVLRRGLADPDRDIRAACAEALATLEPPEAPALLHPDLPRSRHDRAIEALAALARSDPAVLPLLGEALDHAEESVRRRAAVALGRSGSAGLAVLAPAFRPDRPETTEGLLAGGAEGTLLLFDRVPGSLDHLPLPERWPLGGETAVVVAAAERLLDRVRNDCGRWPRNERWVFGPHRPRPDSFWPAVRTVAGAGAPARPVVARALGGDDPLLRRTALAVVDEAGAAGAAFLEEVLGLLSDLPPDERRAAALFLARLLADPAKVLPVLAEDLGPPEDAAPYLGPADGWGRLGARREEDAEAMALYGARAADFLLPLLDGAEPWRRAGFAMVLVRVGEPEVAARAVVRLLADCPPDLAFEALETARALGPPARASVPSLRALARGGAPYVRCAAVRALGAVAPEDPETARAALDLLDPADAGRFVAAHETLRILGPRAAKAVPRLREELASGVHWRAGHAAETLAAIGAAAAPAFPDVEERLDLLRACAVPFAASQGAKGVRLLARMLDGMHRHDALAALAKLGPEAGPAVPEIVALLAGPLRWEAVDALRAVGPPAREAREPLEALLAGEFRTNDERVLAAMASIRGDL